jgi:RimJ/RimL family protein N-acetyltransferase
MLIRDATKEDLDYAIEHSISRGEKENPDAIEFVFALEDKDELLAVGGLKLLNMSTAWCWVNWTTDAFYRKKDAYRHTKGWLEQMCKTLKLRRLMAAVRMDFPGAINMVEHLGFERECEMKNFFGNESAYLYAKTME